MQNPVNTIKLTTCGSVDDGKSTLIGKLLYDTSLIYDDHLNALSKDSKKYGTTDTDFDLALLVDGLQAEREQGITIDVAYKYFEVKQRKYILADSPGHDQYTCNMVTAASSSDVAILLIDVQNGITQQTRRHAYILSLLNIQNVIVVINKMDLVGYDQQIYKKTKNEFKQFCNLINLNNIKFVPISALKGDNIVEYSKNMQWYPGSSLLKLLETINVDKEEIDNENSKFIVQYVNRPDQSFRGYCGKVVSGSFKEGDEVIVLPSGRKSQIKEIIAYNQHNELVTNGESTTFVLTDQIDISRGNLVYKGRSACVSNYFRATLIWLGVNIFNKNTTYVLKTLCKTFKVKEIEVENIVDISNPTVKQPYDKNIIRQNDIFSSNVQTLEPVIFDNYSSNKNMGSFILIDPDTNQTVAAGLIEGSLDNKESSYNAFELELNALIRKYYPHWGTKELLG